MSKKNLVSIMISQHRVLQKEIGSITEILKKKEINFRKIIQGLEEFKKDLVEHLNLENDVFYVDLLKKMKNQGIDTKKTEKFISEMKEIEKTVNSFLEKYKSVEKIKEDIEKFKKTFPEIGEMLNIRIESEEAGVYDYWKLL